MIRLHKVSISRACRILNLSRSVYHYKTEKEDNQVMDVLQRKVGENSHKGFWKIYQELREEGYPWNHKKIYRVYKTMGLTIKARVKNKLPLRKKELLKLPTELNHTWTLDFAQGDIVEGKSIYSIHVMDEQNREALHVEVDYALSAHRVAAVLNLLTKNRKKPKRVQIISISALYTIFLEDWGLVNKVEMSFMMPNEQTLPIIMESLHTVFKREVLDAYLFYYLKQVQDTAQAWLKDYNTRPHKALGGLSPLQYSED